VRVLATAGHVDHGKSTLVRALTGMEPDRWAEERRRGLTIDLGFGWLELPSGEPVAFVDVPGHQRFVPNMLAGVGPVPAVLLVLLLIATFYHNALGLQVVIEDYVENEALRFGLIIIMKLASVVLAVLGIFAVLKLSFAG